MPRKYTKKKIPQYSQEDLINAVQNVHNDGISIYAAAKKYKIPSTTLYDKINRTYNTNFVGRPLAIPREMENQLADAIKTMERWGFGLSREEVLNLVSEFVKSNNLVTPFRNNKPGKDWFINFRKRHRLSIKKPQPVEFVRKKMTDPFVISEYFNLLKDTLTNLNLFERPNLIWNMDETSLCLDPTKTKVVGAINKPCSRTTCGTGKENITVLTTVSASGDKLSPLIVFKGKNIWDQWMASTENYNFELSYAASAKGWMESDIFYNYMEKILIPALGEERPVLIIYDGHSTHVDVKVIELAIKNDVTILKLPPHTSHLLQPLDVAVFKSFKTKWDHKLVDWQRRNIGVKMPKKVFAQTFAQTWHATNPNVIKSGFKKAGIYPFNCQVIQQDKYDPAAYRRFIQPPTRIPKRLKTICLESIKKTFEMNRGIVDQENVILFTTHRKTCNENQPFVANSPSNLPICLQRNHIVTIPKNKQPKINIVSDIKVNFEELLLEKIRQDKKDNTYIKKKKVAKGAEVITLSINKKNMEEKENHESIASVSGIQKTKTRNSNCKVKSKTHIAKTYNIPGMKNRKQNKRKSKLEDSNSSSTSISDILSIYSEVEFDDLDFESLADDFSEETSFDTQNDSYDPSTQEIICNFVTNERKILSEADANTITKKNIKGKGKGKGKHTMKGKENNDLKDGDIQRMLNTDKVLTSDNEIQNDYKTKNSNTEDNITNIKTKVNNIPYNKTENNDKTEGEKIINDKAEEITKDEADDNEYKVNDTVLVRYYIKNKWNYYIGLIEKICKKQNNETFYIVNFYKTIRKPYLTFIKPKRQDRDEIRKILIVKKVDIEKKNDKEYNLTDENDTVFF